jgi:pimeloyl-ACP methyl ester carboxylesterase
LEIPKLDLAEGHFRVPSNRDGLSLFLRYLPPTKHTEESVSQGRIVLYVHGATFPSAMSIAHRFVGRSWRDELAAAGFHVWGLDFLGFGGSDRFPEMAKSPVNKPALGRADDASQQIEKAVRFIVSHHQVERISIIAHSWGCIATGRFANRCPELVHRLVFFAPITRRKTHSEAPIYPAWRLISLKDQWDRFVEDVPPGEAPVLVKRDFDEWGRFYLNTDFESETRNPPAVKIPTGPLQDIQSAWAGDFAFDLGAIVSPVAIIRGQWDTWSNDDDARWLLDALKRSPVKRQVTVSRGTHLLHLEESRYALYREAQTFLSGEEPVSEPRPAATDCHKTTKRPTMKMVAKEIPGYTYGTAAAARSPISLDDLEKLKQSVGFAKEDEKYLRLAGEVLGDQTEEITGHWRKIIGETPHLARHTRTADGKPIENYSHDSGMRLQQWILDTCLRPYDQDWLNYQQEIALRHTTVKKNQTDHAQSTPHIPFRDVNGFWAVINDTIKPYLAHKGHSAEDVEKMHRAWCKSTLLQAALWAEPYTNTKEAPNQW